MLRADSASASGAEGGRLEARYSPFVFNQYYKSRNKDI